MRGPASRTFAARTPHSCRDDILGARNTGNDVYQYALCFGGIRARMDGVSLHFAPSDIFRLGRKLGVRQQVIATAVVYFRRYYTR